MKRLVKTALLSGAALTLATAAAAEGPVSWWYEQANPEQQAILEETLAQPFEAANPGSDLTIDYRGMEVDRQLRVALLSGSGPDIVYTSGPSYVAPMAQAGQLMPLDDYAARYGWADRILPVFLEMGRYEGTLYAVPKTYETLALFYNASLLEEHGWTPPTTLAELETLADAMLAEDIVPFASGNANWRPANEHYVSLALNAVAGPDKVYQALRGEIPWTDPAFVEAIEALDGWWAKGYFGPDYFSLSDEQAVAMLARGEAGMMPTGTWQFQRAPAFFAEAGATPGFMGFPSREGDPVFPLGIGSTFSISATAANPDGAAAVIDYVFSTEFYQAIGARWQGEWNVPLSDLSGVELGADVSPLYTEAMATLAASVDQGNYGYTTWTFLPPATDTYLVSGIEQVWLDQITVEDFLAELDAQFQAELAEGKVPAVPER